MSSNNSENSQGVSKNRSNHSRQALTPKKDPNTPIPGYLHIDGFVKDGKLLSRNLYIYASTRASYHTIKTSSLSNIRKIRLEEKIKNVLNAILKDF